MKFKNEAGNINEVAILAAWLVSDIANSADSVLEFAGSTVAVHFRLHRPCKCQANELSTPEILCSSKKFYVLTDQ